MLLETPHSRCEYLISACSVVVMIVVVFRRTNNSEEKTSRLRVISPSLLGERLLEMYASFDELTSGDADIPQAEAESFIVPRGNQSLADTTAASAPPDEGGTDPSSYITPQYSDAHRRDAVFHSLRAMVQQSSETISLPLSWKKMRFNLPSSVAELRLQPALPDNEQYTGATNTIVINLNITPEVPIAEFCADMVRYVADVMQFLNAQAPILSLKFVKSGREVSQMVITMGDATVTRLLHASLYEGLHARAAVLLTTPKAVEPSATFQFWDLKKTMNANEGLSAKDIEDLIGEEVDAYGSKAGSVSVVKAFDDGVWYAALHRPASCYNWLMNPFCAAVVQREMYSKFGVLMTIAQCEHEWKQRKGQLNVRAEEGDDADEGDGEEEEVFIESRVDIVGVGKSLIARQYEFDSSEVPELVADDDEEKGEGESDAVDKGLFPSSNATNVAEPHIAWNFSPSGHVNAGQQFFAPPPPPVYPMDSYMGLQQIPISFQQFQLQQQQHRQMMGHPFDDKGPVLPSLLPLPHQGNAGPNDYYRQPMQSFLPSGVLDLSAATPIAPPARIHIDKMTANITNAFDMLCSKEVHPVIRSMIHVNMPFIGSENKEDLVRSLLDVLLSPIPRQDGAEGPQQLVLDRCMSYPPQYDLLLALVNKYHHHDDFIEAVVDRVICLLERPNMKQFINVFLELDPTCDNKLLAALLQSPLAWVKKYGNSMKHYAAFRMVTLSTFGLRSMFVGMSDDQRQTFYTRMKSLSVDDVRELVGEGGNLGRCLLLSTLQFNHDETFGAQWLLSRLGSAPRDMVDIARLVDLACVCNKSNGDSLISDAVIAFAGSYCARVNVCEMPNDEKLEFLHQAILRRIFSAARDKYSLIRKAFFDELSFIGAASTALPLGPVLSSSSWPPRPQWVQSLPIPAVPPPQYVPSATTVQASVLAAPESSKDPCVAVSLEFDWKDSWSAVFESYPPSGVPFPELVDSVGGATEGDSAGKPEEGGSVHNAEPVHWKHNVSKSYGHFYFKSDAKNSKPTYKHPQSLKAYMVSPQYFMKLEANHDEKAFLARNGIDEEEYNTWKGDQRHRNKRIDVAVLKELKINYKDLSGSHGGESKTAQESSTVGKDNSSFLKAQRDLERKLRFVRDLEYPSRGHPFPQIPKGWTVSLSYSNGLYFFRGPNGDTTYQHPVSKKEYVPTPQAYAFFGKLTAPVLVEKCQKLGVTKERVDAWIADQTVRDAELDWYVSEKLDVRYDTKSKKRARSRDQ